MSKNTKECIEELRRKRDTIKDLEKKYSVTNINFAVREGAKVTIDEAMDYIAGQIKNSAELIKQRKSLIDHGFSPPKR